MTRAFTAYFVGVVLMLISVLPVAAGTYEDADAAYKRGDFETALRLFRPLAAQGDAGAQFTLGFMYYSGQSVPQNYAEAAKWFRLAAVQGDAPAQYNLGFMYNKGEGVPQNDGEAEKWYRLAADQGYPDAQFNVGVLYYKGQGVPQNYVRAHMWFSLAAAGDYKGAAKVRDSLARLMTPGQIAEAQKQAAEWTPKTSNASAPEITPRFPPSSRKPETAAASGTAFFVSADGAVLTNAHVVEGCQQIRVNGGTARLLARDVKNDLALLATGLHPAQWAKWKPLVRLGEDVVAYGFPLTGTLSSNGNVTTGIVAALAGVGDDSRFLQISAPVQPGNSGGPLFDRYGNVVGVVVAKLNALKIASATGDIPQNINFAVKASVATAFLESQRITISINPSPPPGYTLDVFSTPDTAALAQALTVQVICFQQVGLEVELPDFPAQNKVPPVPTQPPPNFDFPIPGYPKPSDRGNVPQPPDKPNLIALRSEALDFVNRYIWYGNEEADRSIHSIEDMFAEQVFHFGKLKTKPEVLAEEAAHWERWPRQKYTLRPESVSIACSLSPDQCTVDAILDWDASSASRNERSTGSSTWHVVLSKSQEVMTISAMDGKVLNKRISKLNLEPEGCLGLLCLFGPGASDGDHSSGASEKRLLRVSSKDGYLNLRDGPGIGHALISAMPLGAVVRQVGGCVKGDDNLSRYKWCKVEWNGSTGWASAYGLELAEPKPE